MRQYRFYAALGLSREKKKHGISWDLNKKQCDWQADSSCLINKTRFLCTQGSSVSLGFWLKTYLDGGSPATEAQTNPSCHSWIQGSATERGVYAPGLLKQGQIPNCSNKLGWDEWDFDSRLDAVWICSTKEFWVLLPQHGFTRGCARQGLAWSAGNPFPISIALSTKASITKVFGHFLMCSYIDHTPQVYLIHEGVDLPIDGTIIAMTYTILRMTYIRVT